MTHFFKGVGVGTYFHSMDLRLTGISPAASGAKFDDDMVKQHVCLGPKGFPCISVTRSYGVAESYARNGDTPPSPAVPGYVYVINIPNPLPSGAPQVIDPVCRVAARNHDPLTSPSYHHNGSQQFLLGVVSPSVHPSELSAPAPTPQRAMPSIGAAILTLELQTMVWALRDAEALIVGTVPSAWVIDRLDVF